MSLLQPLLQKLHKSQLRLGTKHTKNTSTNTVQKNANTNLSNMVIIQIMNMMGIIIIVMRGMLTSVIINTLN